MRVRTTVGLIVVGLAFAGPQVVRGVDLGSAFTYQGELLDNGVAVDGMTEFEFTLWDDAVAGVQQAAMAPVMIDVVQGRFTATVDFGAAAFPGNARFLQISVTPPGAGSPTVLSRQELTPAPAALAMPGVKAEQTAGETALTIAGATPFKVSTVDATGEFVVKAESAADPLMRLNAADGIACFGAGNCLPLTSAIGADGFDASVSVTNAIIFDPGNKAIQLADGKIVKVDSVTSDVVVTSDLCAEGNVDAVVPAAAGASADSLLALGVRLNALAQRVEPIDAGMGLDINPGGQTTIGDTVVEQDFQAKKMAKFGINSLEIDGDARTIRPTDPAATLFLDAANVCLGSSCCVANPGGTGCQDLTCETAVCTLLPTCCSTAWTQACADQAAISCPTLCAPKDLDVTGDQAVAGNSTVEGDSTVLGTFKVGNSIDIDGVLNTISSTTSKIGFTNDQLVDVARLGIGTSAPGFPLDARGTVFQLKTTGGSGPLLQMVGDDTADVAIGLCNIPAGPCSFIFDDDSDAHALKLEAPEFAVNIGGPAGEAFRIDSAKNVGIGTTGPETRFHALTSASTNVGILESTHPNDNAWLWLVNPVSRAAGGFNDVGLAAIDRDLHLRAGDSSRLVVQGTTGNVGIGTSVPAQNLNVSSSAFTEARVETTASFGSARLSLKSTGGVNDELRIQKGGPTASGTVGGIALANLSYIFAGAQAGALMLDVVTNNPMHFLTNNVERMRITGSGNVGIGTANPGGHRLQVTAAGPPSGFEVVQLNSTATLTSAEDLLALEVPSGSSDTMQFIECSRGSTNVFQVQGDGEAIANGHTCVGSNCLIFSSLMGVSGGPETVEPGDVMVINVNGSGSMIKSAGPRSTLVVGICASGGNLATEHSMDELERAYRTANPELYVGEPRGSINSDGIEASRTVHDPARDSEGFKERLADGASVAQWVDPSPSVAEMGRLFGEVPVATRGIVPCKVSAENGAIRPGDLLVTGSTPGHAMRDDNPKVGTLVGKALESLDKGTGTIRVLVTLQ